MLLETLNPWSIKIKQTKAEMELWILKMYLLEETAAAIWYCFCNYLNMKDKAFFENITTDNTISRNIAAHDGNILTDHMLVSSYLTVYISTFEELYSIPHIMIECYSGMYPNLIVIIFTKKLQNWKEWYKYSTNVLQWLPIWHFMLLSGMKCTTSAKRKSGRFSASCASRTQVCILKVWKQSSCASRSFYLTYIASSWFQSICT